MNNNELEITIDVNRLPKHIGIKDPITGLRILTEDDRCAVNNWVIQQLPERNDCNVTVKMMASIPVYLACGISALLCDRIDKLIYLDINKEYVIFDKGLD